jgi:hypothetical protein
MKLTFGPLKKRITVTIFMKRKHVLDLHSAEIVKMSCSVAHLWVLLYLYCVHAI